MAEFAQSPVLAVVGEDDRERAVVVQEGDRKVPGETERQADWRVRRRRNRPLGQGVVKTVQPVDVHRAAVAAVYGKVQAIKPEGTRKISSELFLIGLHKR